MPINRSPQQRTLAQNDAIKARVLSQLNRRKSESLLWNISGSTLLHVLIILGFGFYITQPDPVLPERTLSVNLVPNSELSTETLVGSGKPIEQADSQPELHRDRKVLRVEQQQNRFEDTQFQLAPQNLMEEIKEINKAIEKTERVGFLGVYDTHPSYRQYQQYWQNYVSEFGTRHYPRELVEKGLNGSLELDIAIDRKGNVRSAKIHRSSGNSTIDRAAVRVAMAAGPYAPLPEEMAREIDILHIIRTWEFNNNTLTSHAGSSR